MSADLLILAAFAVAAVSINAAIGVAAPPPRPTAPPHRHRCATGAQRELTMLNFVSVYPVVIAVGTVIGNVALTIGGHQPRCARQRCRDCPRTRARSRR
ncbi:hypothetical protein IU450_37640 [Nocardia abscessus]|uniref:hypothetical protein n=1 Tax=Nocardia abscessus TaxID=120957 RepID=UPI0018944455|nr:hypothetical protein [Nocardia abscessus]MBF6341560.1 hypothetical protein [Nocardia abscessus]